MSLFLRERGVEFEVTEYVIGAAAGNKGNWQGIMNLLLQHRRDKFTVTKRVIKAARGNTTNTMDIINFLLQESIEETRPMVVEELRASRYQYVGDAVLDSLRSDGANINFDDSMRDISDIVWEASPGRIRIAVEMLLPNLSADDDMEKSLRSRLFDKDGAKRSAAFKSARIERCDSVVRLLLQPSAPEPSASSTANWPSWTRAIVDYLRSSPRRSGT
ncbi:hypothetical protein IG631_21931 [Alternaria alternata]|nr:hypothetical protein IG631_21931 [Alternaria alternata]